MTKHTPGPWTLGGGETITSITQEGGCRVTRYIAAVFPNKEWPEEQYLANLRLIKAAPLMYEALKEIVEVRKNARTFSDESFEIGKIVRKAIAAVEGQS